MVNAETLTEEVLTFWFGNDEDDARVAASQAGLWWGKDSHSDESIRDRFGNWVSMARAGELDHLASTARGRLAVIILIDQFSRNLHRNSASAFSADTHALAVCQQGLEEGMDKVLRPIERVFFYLPLEHAEDLICQRQCQELMQALANEVPQPWRKTFNQFADYARRHREVIERFGRFPHRNEALARRSTDAELDYLSQPGAGF